MSRVCGRFPDGIAASKTLKTLSKSRCLRARQPPALATTVVRVNRKNFQRQPYRIRKISRSKTSTSEGCSKVDARAERRPARVLTPFRGLRRGAIPGDVDTAGGSKTWFWPGRSFFPKTADETPRGAPPSGRLVRLMGGHEKRVPARIDQAPSDDRARVAECSP